MKFLALLCTVVASGCTDGSVSALAPETDGERPLVIAQEIVASVEGNCVANEPCEIRVIVSSKSRAIGAYQGRLRLDPRVVKVVRAPTSRDAFHLVNPALNGAGEVRFAGFSTTGEQRVEALSATVMVVKGEELNSIRADLDVAADAAGNRIGEKDLASQNRIVLVR